MLAGTIGGIATVAGNLGAPFVKHVLQGSIAGVSAFAGELKAKRLLAGAIAALSTFTGNLELLAVTHQLQGSIAGTGAVTGDLKLTPLQLQGSIVGQSAATGDLAAVQPNLWSNASIEYGIGDWTGISSTITWSTAQAWHDTYSIKVDTEVAGYAGVQSDIHFSVEPLTQYRMSAYVYNTHASELIGFVIRDQDYNQIGSLLSQSSTQNQWVRHDFTFTTGAGDTGIRLKVQKMNTATEFTFYVDAVKLELAGIDGDANMRSLWYLEETSGDRSDEKAGNDLIDTNGVGYSTDSRQGTNSAEFEKDNSERLSRAVQPTGFPGGSGGSTPSEFTIGIWIKFSSDTGAFQRVYYLYDVYDVLRDNSEYINFWTTSGTNIIADAAAANDVWYHVVVRWQGTIDDELSMWINGEKQADSHTSISTWNSSTQSLDVGSYRSGASNFFDGRLDELFVMDRALTDAEIQRVYAHTVAGPAAATPWSDGPIPLAGTIAGQSAFTGDLVVGETHVLQGAVAGVGTVAGDLTVIPRFPQYEDNAGIQASTGTGKSFTLPATIAADDVLLLQIGSDDDEQHLPTWPWQNKNMFPDSQFDFGYLNMWNDGELGASTVISRDTGTYKYGSASLKVVTDTGLYDGVEIHAWREFPTNLFSTAMVLSVWIYNTDDTVTFEIEVQNAGDGQLAISSDVSSTQDEWVRHELSFTSGSVSNYLSVRVSKYNDATALTYYVDGFQIETGSTATSYVASASRWIQIEPPANEGISWSVSAFWLRCDGTEDGKITKVIREWDANIVCGVIHRYSDVINSGNPIEDSATAGITQSQAASVSSVETKGRSRRCLCMIAVEDDKTLSGGTNYSEVFDLQTTTGDDATQGCYFYEKKDAGVVSSETVTIDGGADEWWGTVTIVLIPQSSQPLAGAVAAQSTLTGNLRIIKTHVLQGKTPGTLLEETFEGSAIIEADENYPRVEGYDHPWGIWAEAGTGTLDPDADPADVSSPSGWGTNCLKVNCPAASDGARVIEAKLGSLQSNPVTFSSIEFVVTAETFVDTDNEIFFNLATYGDQGLIRLGVDHTSGEFRGWFAVRHDWTWNDYYFDLTLGQVYRFEVKWDSAADTWEVWLDGVSQGSGSLTSTAATSNVARVLLGIGAAINPITLYMDNLRIGTARAGIGGNATVSGNLRIVGYPDYRGNGGIATGDKNVSVPYPDPVKADEPVSRQFISQGCPMVGIRWRSGARPDMEHRSGVPQ
ncbi:MAG: LamG-like jellyroll fold domain-containing protein [Planctomycetota bacterium]